MDKYCGIYKITSPSKKIYIGQSYNILARWDKYRRLQCKGQFKLYNSLVKYGYNRHKFEIVCICEISELNRFERFYQDIYSAAGINGLNLALTDTLQERKKYSIETRIKMSIAKTGRTISDETKKRMSLAMKGKVSSKLSYEKMAASKRKIILNFETGIYYIGIKDAAFSVNKKTGTLNEQLNNVNKNRTKLKYV